MIQLPDKINSLVHNGCSFDLSYVRNIGYTINKGEDTETNIYACLPKYYRPAKTNFIAEYNSPFKNGFKVVKMANEEYAYIRESDQTLMPFRYDIAFNFNEYGFAMVGKEGNVSWIDKNFNYLNSMGEMVRENLEEEFIRFDGWKGVKEFSKGDIPLSQVYDNKNTYGRMSYFGIDGKIKDFYQYNGQINYSFPKTTFMNGTSFDEKGYAKADNNILFAKGYYISYEDLIKICMEKGFIDNIGIDVDECFDKRKILKLK